MERQCLHCGETYSASRSTAKFCSGRCKTAAVRQRQRDAAKDPARAEAGNVVQLRSTTGSTRATTTTPPPPDVPPVDDGDGPVTAATRHELAQFGQLSSSDGTVALTLARRIDRGVLTETGNSYAALTKAHALALDRAINAGRATAAASEDALRDPVEEYRALRDQIAGMGQAAG